MKRRRKDRDKQSKKDKDFEEERERANEKKITKQNMVKNQKALAKNDSCII